MQPYAFALAASLLLPLSGTDPAFTVRVVGHGRPMLLNPGSVGQPRDGDPTASWLEIDTDAGVATWRRVGYDVEAVRTAMFAAGLPGRLADRIRIGL